MCIGARSGSNPGPLDSEPSVLTNCASCSLVPESLSDLVLWYEENEFYAALRKSNELAFASAVCEGGLYFGTALGC